MRAALTWNKGTQMPETREEMMMRTKHVLFFGLGLMITVFFGCEECKNSTECTMGTVCLDGVCEQPETKVEVMDRSAIGVAEDGGVGGWTDGGSAPRSASYSFYTLGGGGGSGGSSGGSSRGGPSPLLDTDTNCTPCGK